MATDILKLAVRLSLFPQSELEFLFPGGESGPFFYGDIPFLRNNINREDHWPKDRFVD